VNVVTSVSISSRVLSFHLPCSWSLISDLYLCHSVRESGRWALSHECSTKFGYDRGMISRSWVVRLHRRAKNRR
jgi:hypothetical protein